jgi:hypothetical protein
MKTLEELNEAIAKLPPEERSLISDGYHTFEELYTHRCVCFIALVNSTEYGRKKSELHEDGTSYEGWFIVQGYVEGKQVAYHLPMVYRDLVVAMEVEK